MKELDLPPAYMPLHEALKYLGGALCHGWVGAEIGPDYCKPWGAVPEHGAERWMVLLAAWPTDGRDPQALSRLRGVSDWVRTKGLSGQLKLFYFNDHGILHCVRQEDFSATEGPAVITTGYLFDKPVFVDRNELKALVDKETNYLGDSPSQARKPRRSRPVSDAELKHAYVSFRLAYQKQNGRLPGRSQSITWGRETYGERVTDSRLRAVYEQDAKQYPRLSGRPRKPGQKPR